mmetsp:Transcript_24720/g.79584  ORF Transcript_24720/g.79584 Transcript_24720/m.79584 type:complete len:149 (+) Transcript_24720:420-866(+)
MVDNRCAITIVVRPCFTRASASWMPRSVMVSSELVASSSTSTGGFLSSVRAMATRCFSPPDSLRPRSPTTESYFLDSVSMNGWICASTAARTTSPCDEPGLPYPMLCDTVSLNSTVSCGTMPISLRSDCCVTSRMLRPPIRISPSVTS